ncbi:flagellar filament capping protein FliD [Aquipuribacter hungaricus]|uniref:Flagellar hook-associated protein 2 n=1 Tax=Aquipuribacter hungaricus TaxID=545624 RepID=A0ABV7WLN0_9MICO
MSMSSVDGLVSGLKTGDVIKQLMQVEAIPKQRLQVQANRQAADIKAYQSVATALKKLDDAASALANPTTWTGVTATTSGTSLTATARAGAPPGTTDITVTSLASAARWSATAVGGRTLDDATAFSGDPVTITRADGTSTTVDPASGSMRDVMAAINGGPDLGVRAVAVRVDAERFELQLVASGTGTVAGGATVTGLGALTKKDATDARWTVNGVSGSSSTNAVTDLVSGIDVTLTQVGASSVTVAKDTAAPAKSVEALVTALNDALAEVKKQTLTDPNATTRGPLSSDSMVRNLTGRLLRSVTDLVGSAGAAALGIQSTREGTITLDTTKLAAGISADPAAARAVFAPQQPTAAEKAAGKPEPVPGIADRLRAVVKSATDGGTGFITSAVQGRETTKRDLETQIVSWERRLELRQSTLQKQFSGLEVALSKIQAQGGWLSAQLAQMSGGNR